MDESTANGAGRAFGVAVGLILSAGMGNLGSGRILGIVSPEIAGRRSRERDVR